MAKVSEDAFDSVHVTAASDKFIVLSIGGEWKPPKGWLEPASGFRAMRGHRRHADHIHTSKNRHAVLTSSQARSLAWSLLLEAARLEVTSDEESG